MAAALLDALAAAGEAADGPLLRPTGDALLGLMMLRGNRRRVKVDGEPGSSSGGAWSGPESGPWAFDDCGPSGASGHGDGLALARHILSRLLLILGGDGGDAVDSPCAGHAAVSPALHALHRSCARILYEAADVLDLRVPMVEAGCVGALTELCHIDDFSADTIHTAGRLTGSTHKPGGGWVLV